MLTASFYVAAVFIALLLIVGIGALIIAVLARDGGAAIFGVGVLVFAAIVTVTAYFPFDMQYHRYERIEGQVATIDSRMMSKDNGMEERFIISYEGTGNDYRCDDSRCASVKPGDTLVMNCLRKWEFRAADGYACKFVEWIPAGGGS